MRAALTALASLLIVACSSPAPASPTAAPAKPSEASAGASPVAKPAGSPAPAASPSAANTTPPSSLAKPTGGPSPQQVAEVIDGYWQKAKAANETRVVLYGGLGPDWDPLLDAFKAKYPGMQVEQVNLRGPEMLQRIDAEAASGKMVANIATHGQTTMSTLDKAGGLTSWEGPPTASMIPLPALTEGKTRWSYAVSLYSSIINTDLVPKDKIPSSRKDLLDPFWKGKGKLLIEDPRGNGPGLDVFTINTVQLGQPWLDALKAQEPTFVRDRDNAPYQVARGEYAMFYPVNLTVELFELEKNAPVKVNVLTDGGTSIQEATVGVIKNAPGQDAAKMFVSWLLSEEGQTAMVQKRRTYAAMPGMPPPVGYPPIEQVNPGKRTADQISRNNEFIEQFDRTFFR